MANVTKENIGNLHEKLTVKVSKEDYQPSFEKALKNYSKKANIPGFRKGMVPVGMVKKMYGASIFYDEVIKTVEKELQDYLIQEKPAIFANPLPLENDLRTLDMNQPSEYQFPFEIGLKPDISLEVLCSVRPTFYRITVTPEMVDEEIEKLVSKNGDLKDAETVTSPENVLNVLFEESDGEGNVLEGGISRDNSVLVKYFAEEYRQKLQDKKVGDALVLQLKEAFMGKEREWLLSDLQLDPEDAASNDKFFKMSIQKIGLVEKKELNEDFFKIVFPGKDLNTKEEFTKAIEEEIQKQWDDASRNQFHDQLYHALVDIPLEFPESFLKRWLEIGGEKQKSSEQVEEEYPKFREQLKWTLISDKIIQDNQIQVSQDELRESIREEITRYLGGMHVGDDASWLEGYVNRMLSNEKQVDSTYRRLITEKVFKWLETQVTPEEKSISSEEFLKIQEHHHH